MGKAARLSGTKAALRLTALVLALGVSAGQVRALDLQLVVPEGAPSGLAGALRAASTLVQAVDEGDTGRDTILSAARADYARLTGVLYARGHFGSVVRILLDGREAADISALALPAQVRRVEVRVDPGPIFRFARLEVAPLAPGTALPEAARSGEPAGVPAMRAAVRAGVDGWRDAGHPTAQAGRQQITADHRANTVDARFAIEPGPPARFGRMALRGNEVTREGRIREIAGFPEGVRFTPAELDRVAARLRRSGAFSAVSIREGAEVNPDGTLDIEVVLSEAPLRRFGAGAELTTDRGLALSGFWMHRNLFGGANRLRLDGRIDGIGGSLNGIDGRLGLRFTRPGTFGPDNDLSLGAEVRREERPGYRANVLELDASLTRIFSERLTGSVGVTYWALGVQDGFGNRSFRILSVPATLTWDGRDERLDPTSGLYAAITAMPFASLGGGWGGARTTADLRAYQAFGDEARVVLAGRLQLGALAGPATARMPPNLLFYSGGGGTVRGQRFESLGVTTGGTFTGGRSFLGLSGEARVKLGGNWGVAGFVDAGHVGRTALPGTDGNWHAGAGIGLRYDLGIGPLRVDVAVPVGGGGGRGVFFYLGIGQAF